jgi:putative DNA primase/helicase
MTADAIDGPRAISRMLAERVDQLVADLLPAGYREGHEWRCGSVAGEPGDSLGVHLTGSKAGIWSDFAAGTAGDALDLVRAVLGLGMGEALVWSRRWLGLEKGDAALPRRPASASSTMPPDPNHWRAPWQKARPIADTLAAVYLDARSLRFDDPKGEVLRFIARHRRRNPAGEPEHHPAMLALLRHVRTGEPCGIINVYLAGDGSDRLRDKKGKTSWGRAAGAAVMLSAFDEPTYGLTLSEGVETGIALWMAEQWPAWCCGGAGNLTTFPVLSGIECLTIAADPDEPGQRAAATAAERWRGAGREVAIITPPAGDWAQPERRDG